MPQERFKIIPAVFLIVKKHDEVFLLRRYNTGYADGWYTLPSGHVEEGETPSAAVIREAKEEVGIGIFSDQLLYCGSMYTQFICDNKTYLYMFYQVDASILLPSNAEPGKSDDARWFSWEQLPKNILPYIVDALVSIQREQIPFYFEKQYD